MKKLVCAALVFMVLFTGTACGSGREESNPDIEKEASVSGELPPDVDPERAKESETGSA